MTDTDRLIQAACLEPDNELKRAAVAELLRSDGDAELADIVEGPTGPELLQLAKQMSTGYSIHLGVRLLWACHHVVGLPPPPMWPHKEGSWGRATMDHLLQQGMISEETFRSQLEATFALPPLSAFSEQLARERRIEEHTRRIERENGRFLYGDTQFRGVRDDVWNQLIEDLDETPNGS